MDRRTAGTVFYQSTGRRLTLENMASMSKNSSQLNRVSSRLILASMSPRRAALMREYGYEVEIVAPPIDEPNPVGRELPPAHLAQALSYFKAQAVATSLDAGVILAGDTVVALGQQIFGKAVDRADARRILTALTGTTHEVVTGVTLLDAATGERDIRHASTTVTMRQIPEDLLEAYLDSKAWIGKAGAFGIQDYNDPFVSRFEGSFTNIVGFPMTIVTSMLAGWGIFGRE